MTRALIESTQINCCHSSRSRKFQRDNNKLQKFVDIRSTSNKSISSFVSWFRTCLRRRYRNVFAHQEKTRTLFTLNFRRFKEEQHIHQICEIFFDYFSMLFLNKKIDSFELITSKKKLKIIAKFCFFRIFRQFEIYLKLTN